MEEDSNTKQKISKSRARHLRRKRLTIARRTIETDSSSDTAIRKELKVKTTTGDNIVIDSNSTSKDSRTESENNHQLVIKSVKNQRNQSELIKSNISLYKNDFIADCSHNNILINCIDKVKMNNTDEKSRELVKAEREAKKAAKAAAKNKGKNIKQNDESIKTCTSVEKKIEAQVSKDNNVSALVDNLSKVKIENSEVKKEQSDKNDGKSKAELKAERRAKQEAQRALKAEQEKQKLAQKLEASAGGDVVAVSKKSDDLKSKIADSKDIKKISQKLIANKSNEHEISLFKHLYQEREQAYHGKPSVNSNIHPAIIRLGVQYEKKNYCW